MQARFGRVWAALAASSLMGCAGPTTAPGGGGGPTPAVVAPAPPDPLPSPILPVSPLVRISFAEWPVGALPADIPFVDVFSELQGQGKNPPSWLYRGDWEIADVATKQVNRRMLKQAKVQERPPITLLRYRGAFAGGSNGAMPDHYRMEVTQQPMRSPYNLPPTGDQGVQPYYLDANHYVEVVTTPAQLQLWVCNGGVPDNASGWRKLWSDDLATQPGDARRVGAVVDRRAKRFTLLYNGVERADVTVDLIDPHRVAGCSLRAIGNEVNFADFELERLP